MPDARLKAYFQQLGSLLMETQIRNRAGDDIPAAQATANIISRCRKAHEAGNKVMFAGNGGCAGLCSHMAIDFTKNGGIRAMAMNDASALTCLGNDFGYEYIFSRQIEYLGNKGDILIAMSASGRSANILNAVEAAGDAGFFIITLSGFTPDNPLRDRGDINFYIDSPEFGFVETGYQAILHGILDIAMGWKD